MFLLKLVVVTNLTDFTFFLGSCENRRKFIHTYHTGSYVEIAFERYLKAIAQRIC